MKININQLRNYKNSIIDDSIAENLLAETIAWISSNLDPEDVFDYCDLHYWATENGFEKE
jgi:hypothetical protein